MCSKRLKKFLIFIAIFILVVVTLKNYNSRKEKVYFSRLKDFERRENLYKKSHFKRSKKDNLVFLKPLESTQITDINNIEEKLKNRITKQPDRKPRKNQINTNLSKTLTPINLLQNNSNSTPESLLFIIFSKQPKSHRKVKTVNTSPIENKFVRNNVFTGPFMKHKREILHASPHNSNNSKWGLNVYYYNDICGRGLHPMWWNPLFPNIPHQVRLRPNISQAEWLPEQFRRIVAFLTPQASAWYYFQLSANTETMFLLADSKFQNETFLVNIIISDRKFSNQKTSKAVFLRSDRRYLLDLSNAWSKDGKIKLQWKRKESNVFVDISSENLTPFDNSAILFPSLPHFDYFSSLKRQDHLVNDLRNLFWKRKLLTMESSLNECEYTPSYLPSNVPDGYGTVFVKEDALYPLNKLTLNHGKEVNISILLIHKNKVDEVVSKYLASIHSEIRLDKIVHVEENAEKNRKRYFLELDLNNNSTIFRKSSWVVLNDDGSMCRAKGYKWNPCEKIYLLTPVKNQGRWLMHLVMYLNRIRRVTRGNNFHLVVVDFQSTDRNVTQILARAQFNYTLLHMRTSRFSKVRGLNHAVSSIEEKEALLFVMDLQLQIPDFLFDQIRKHTFAGRTTYVPIMIRLACGEHPFYTRLKHSVWQSIGYGMISIFKTDWNKIGGMNETRFGEKWGGEDWEFLDRVLRHRLEVIHHRLPGYYHFYHSTKGTWDGTKLH